MKKSLLAISVSVTLWFAWSVAAQPPARDAGPSGFGASPLLAALDTNHDGTLSAEEIAAAAQALKTLDRNSDGRLTSDELRPQFPGRGGAGGPGRPEGPGRADTTISNETPPTAKDEAEQKLLKTLDDIRQQQGRMMNVPALDGRLLRLLAETTGAKTVVEIGTSNGISGIWMGLALKKTGGKLITFEIDPGRAALARKNFEAAGVAEVVTVVEGDAHEKVRELKGPIDMVFLDADKQGYVDYLEKLLPLVRPGGLILAHNMTPRMADPKYLKAITTNPDLETLFYQEAGGMGITLKKR